MSMMDFAEAKRWSTPSQPTGLSVAHITKTTGNITPCFVESGLVAGISENVRLLMPFSKS